MISSNNFFSVSYNKVCVCAKFHLSLIFLKQKSKFQPLSPKNDKISQIESAEIFTNRSASPFLVSIGDVKSFKNQQLCLYRRRTNRLDDQFISNDQFDCINNKTHKSVDILCRRLVRQYKHETQRISNTQFRRPNISIRASIRRSN